MFLFLCYVLYKVCPSVLVYSSTDTTLGQEGSTDIVWETLFCVILNMRRLWKLYIVNFCTSQTADTKQKHFQYYCNIGPYIYSIIK